MEIYQVTYEHIYPNCPEDNQKTAFVKAGSFQEAQNKVESRTCKTEYEHADVIAVCKAKDVIIIA